MTWSPETGVTIVKGTDYTAETAPAAKGEAVGGDSEHPALCARCAKVVRKLDVTL